MMQVMCSRDTTKICDGSCDDPGCMAKHRPKITVACGQCDMLRAERDTAQMLLEEALTVMDANDPQNSQRLRAKWGLPMPPNSNSTP